MTVDENLLREAFLRRERAVINDDLERMFGIFRSASGGANSPGTMSGAEQQMLARACALMSRPRLTCMDEPTMGLAQVFVERGF